MTIRPAFAQRRILTLRGFLWRTVATGSPGAFWLIFPAIVLALLMLRGILLNVPIFGNDDLLYYIDGRYFPQQTPLGKYDVTFGYKPNVLYFAFVQTWHEIAGDNAYLIGRLFQDAIFLVGALTIFLLTRRAFGDAAGRRTALFYLLMPMSIYTASLTPDTLVQAMFYIVALVFGMGWPLRPIATAICLGLVTGAAYLIKPAALGCVPAILRIFRRRRRG